MSIDALRSALLDQDLLDLCRREGLEILLARKQTYRDQSYEYLEKNVYVTGGRPNLHNWISMRSKKISYWDAVSVPLLRSRATGLCYIPRHWLKEQGLHK